MRHRLAMLGCMLIASIAEVAGSAAAWKHQEYDMAPVMFWRPQKVGSSTVLPMLESFSFRMSHPIRPIGGQNSLCRKAAQCALDASRSGVRPAGASRQKMLKLYAAGDYPGAGSSKKDKKRQQQFEGPFKISLTHELCGYGRAGSLHADLKCSLGSTVDVKQLVIVRDPLSRAVSVYYFWGELFKLRRLQKQSPKGKKSNGQVSQLGAAKTEEIKNGLFWYHGNESSPPPVEFAKRYAEGLPFSIGMPGPSYSWSVFGDTPSNAVEYLTAGGVSPMVLERLDESLVVLAHHLGWSLADVVVVKPRKALSQHPRANQWPPEAVSVMASRLRDDGEYKFYDAANALLSARVAELRASSVDVDGEIGLLRQLRDRATKVCFEEPVLNKYRDYLNKHLPMQKKNHLRDVESEYVEAGYLFSLNTHIFYSFDLCGNCEAHAILASINQDPSLTVENAPTLSEMKPGLRAGLRPLLRCPHL